MGSEMCIRDSLYNQTAMSYPQVYRQEYSGEQIREILEDVCDNLFNPNPFLQQGGDMVRVGGMGYTCSPKESMGRRISNMTFLQTGEPIDAKKKYVVAGWGSVQKNVAGPAVYDLIEKHISDRGTVSMQPNEAVKVIGME